MAYLNSHIHRCHHVTSLLGTSVDWNVTCQRGLWLFSSVVGVVSTEGKSQLLTFESSALYCSLGERLRTVHFSRARLSSSSDTLTSLKHGWKHLIRLNLTVLWLLRWKGTAHPSPHSYWFIEMVENTGWITDVYSAKYLYFL